MNELNEWQESLKRAIIKQTGRRDVEVTVGPYRSYDVRVAHKECHPLVDFYSPIRMDPERTNAALAYAVSMLRDWEATLAGRDNEMKIVLPHFETLRSLFPEYQLVYTVLDIENHFVRVERGPGSEILISFDLWPAMKGRDIERLVEYIRKYAAKVKEGATMAGSDYW